MPCLGQCRELVVSGEVFRGDEEAAVELRAGGGVSEHVVLAARLRARAAVRAALADHAGHEALARVRDAERTVHERLESEVGDGGADLPNVLERVLAREHDAVDAKLAHHGRAAGVVHGHLRRRVHLEARDTPRE